MRKKANLELGNLKLEKKKKMVKILKNRVKGEIQERKSIWNKFKGIRVKLLVAFSMPIILMAIFGVVSYQKSAKAIISNYEKSATNTLNAVSDYLDLGMSSVEEKSVEILLGNSYYDRVIKEDTIDDVLVFRKLRDEVFLAQGTNSFIYAIHIFGKAGKGLSTIGTLPENIYDLFLESEEAKKLAAVPKKNLWIGEHASLDEQLKTSKDEYAISFIRNMTYDNGYIILDISTKIIVETLSRMDFGESSIIGFVTSDGSETLTKIEENNIFNESQFYKESVASEETSGYSYERFGDKDYLYLYSKVGDSGAIVCALVPESTIIKQANDIKTLSVIFVSLACIFALLLGTAMAGGIGNAISKLMKSITLAAKGDLTAKFDTKRKDEFNILSKGLTDMVDGMRNLIAEVAEVGAKVSGSAGMLSATSETILGATKDISLTIDEIEKGVVQQSTDTEHCLGQMSNLSDKINQVYGSTYEIEQIANDTKTIVGEGIVIVDELNIKTKATTNITQVVIREIEALVVQSRNIGNFVGVINEIASQTNLLSLNASIEAARAGDAGRGFAVVADEIRKLADQSVKAASQIQSIVTEIQNKTQGTVVSAKQAENIVGSQSEALQRTIHVFENINKHVGKLANNLNNISIGVKGIETAKEDTLDAIRNISAVSQQTAAASEEVSATANNQIDSVENLSRSALELANDAKKLEEAILLFRIK